MKTEFRKATNSEDRLIRSAVEKLLREKLQRFISVASMGGIVLGMVFILSLKLSGGTFADGHFGYLHLGFWTYLFVIGLGYRMYSRKKARMLDGGYQVLAAPMVCKEEPGNTNKHKKMIGITVDSDELEENTIMPVVKKETIFTKVGKRQMKAYEDNAEAVLVKYNLGEGLYDEFDCIPLKF